MNPTNTNNFEKQIDNSMEKYYCNCNYISPLIATGLVVGSALTTATIISPKIRKLTLPVAKFAFKQQLKVLTGLGLLAIATSIISSPEDVDNYLHE